MCDIGLFLAGTGLAVDSGSASGQNAGKSQQTAASEPSRLESVSGYVIDEAALDEGSDSQAR